MIPGKKYLVFLALSAVLLFGNCSAGGGTEDDVPILTFASGPTYSCNMGNLCGNPVRTSISAGTPMLNFAGSISYTNSNPAVATYDDAGNIYPLMPGTCTITATQAPSSYNAKGSASFVLTILPAIPKFTWYQANFFYLGVDAPLDISVGTKIPNPASSTIPNGGPITYTSSNGAVATVDNAGLLTGLSGGSTTITATQAMSNLNVQGSISLGILVDPIPIITFAHGNQYTCSNSSTELCKNAAISSIPNGGYIEYQVGMAGVAFVTSDGTIDCNSPQGTTVTIYASQSPMRGVNAAGSGSFTLTILP